MEREGRGGRTTAHGITTPVVHPELRLRILVPAEVPRGAVVRPGRRAVGRSGPALIPGPGAVRQQPPGDPPPPNPRAHGVRSAAQAAVPPAKKPKARKARELATSAQLPSAIAARTSRGREGAWE